MVTYDVECKVRFGSAIPAEQQVAFKKSVGGHAGWFGPTPIVNWNDPSEALVLLVLRGSGPDEADDLCQSAQTQVREWMEHAGLATGSPPDGLSLECRATPRV